ncbi:DeoR family transcriptional regulator [Streptosporangium sp. DT93]|uniref:DeoR family transcriptional regulator n=1 Tax=Streptosporangium sp. DT93 TaxID=3393428 RepID=UPI003CE8B4E9
MLSADRRSRILESARREGAVRVSRLVGEPGVSHVTVRRDLEALIYDGVLSPREPAGMADPSLTAVAPGGEQVGVVATRLLSGLIGGRTGRTPLHVQIEPRLHIRRITAPVRDA